MTLLAIPTPVRRPLTTAELTAILARIDDADSTGDLLAAVIGAVYDTLLADLGLSTSTLPDGQQLDPRQFQIPSNQWQAITGAVTDRAAAWGTGAQLTLELIGVLPSTYDDPAAPVPDRPASTGDRTCWNCTSPGTRSTSSPPQPHTCKLSAPSTDGHPSSICGPAAAGWRQCHG